MSEPIKTLGDELPKEIKRCRELVKQYEFIGPAGAFGKFMIEQEIEEAERVTREGDVVAMIRALHKLRGCK